MIARAFTCAVLIVIAFNPALVSASTFTSVGSGVPGQGAQAAALVQTASVQTMQKQTGKTASSRCKGRHCLEPAVYQSGLPEALFTADWNSHAEIEDQGMSGFVTGINTPPPKHLVSGL